MLQRIVIYTPCFPTKNPEVIQVFLGRPSYLKNVLAVSCKCCSNFTTFFIFSFRKWREILISPNLSSVLTLQVLFVVCCIVLN